MQIFESAEKKIFRRAAMLLPFLFLAAVCVLFLAGISRTSEDTMAKEQASLTQRLESGAIRTYALTGRYPENLEQLLEQYKITYDSSRFVVEYVPNGSNLLPGISVIPLGGKKGGSS